ncbi:MAG: CoA transferase [Microbacterium sp.]|uniref:CaiB/BaiF CoA transferase family protein n=1 Tax=Microbacterium sp. TaxID=51671 RepID=UPI0039E374ED
MTHGPLSGVRVVDFGHVLAGPYATMLLGALGAEVIKIESRARIDEQRILHGAGASDDPEASSNFFEINLNKLSVTLNLKTPEGVELAKRIVAAADIVMENMRPGVMDRLGLGYAALAEVKPDIIMLSLSGFGATGPLRGYTAYAPCFTCFSGQAHLTGYPDWAPNQLTSSGDSRAGTTGAFAMLMALAIRDLTGEGQYIDLSSSEALNQLIGDQMMDFTMNGRSPRRHGNHVADMAPHQVYPCAGADEWVAIAVRTDAEWQALVAAIGSPSWATEPSFATVAGRLAGQKLIDAKLAEWTSGRAAREIMTLLQDTGVAAMPSFTAEQIFSDPHLIAQGAITEVTHPVLGTRKAIAPPWRLSRTPARISRTAPLLGEHNQEVLRDVVGLSQEELDAFIAAGVVA